MRVAPVPGFFPLTPIFEGKGGPGGGLLLCSSSPLPALSARQLLTEARPASVDRKLGQIDD